MNSTTAVNNLYSLLKNTAPRTKADLLNYLKAYLDIDVPDVSLCAGHSTPADYLWHCYNADFIRPAPVNADAVVWAGRGGGKTVIAALATLLDCIFKPACQVRILAGSETQAGRLYDYLVDYINSGYEDFLAGPIRKNKCSFTNGSSVEVLTQSAASVRGRHVHKLRCDEVELFDSKVFAAAKFVTHSTAGLVAAMETISTMHRPFGLMHRLVTEADDTAVFKWCMFEVIEKCTDRSCSRCPLDSDCAGRAKQAGGYLKIDDCITQMKRSSRTGFESEMLCKRPSLENIVFAQFNPDLHVVPLEYDMNLPLYRAIDFGFVNPFVCLWIQVDGDGTIRVIDEYIKSKETIDTHAKVIMKRFPCSEETVAGTFCDPAGAGVNDVTGSSPVSRLRAAGIRLRYRRSSIADGIELIRAGLCNGSGKSSLLISPRCGRLIEAMQCYHYPESTNDELPHKDGIYDHPIDALRYFFVNYRTGSKPKAIRY